MSKNIKLNNIIEDVYFYKFGEEKENFYDEWQKEEKKIIDDLAYKLKNNESNYMKLVEREDGDGRFNLDLDISIPMFSKIGEIPDELRRCIFEIPISKMIKWYDYYDYIEKVEPIHNVGEESSFTVDKNNKEFYFSISLISYSFSYGENKESIEGYIEEKGIFPNFEVNFAELKEDIKNLLKNNNYSSIEELFKDVNFNNIEWLLGVDVNKAKKFVFFKNLMLDIKEELGLTEDFFSGNNSNILVNKIEQEQNEQINLSKEEFKKLIEETFKNDKFKEHIADRHLKNSTVPGSKFKFEDLEDLKKYLLNLVDKIVDNFFPLKGTIELELPEIIGTDSIQNLDDVRVLAEGNRTGIQTAREEKFGKENLKTNLINILVKLDQNGNPSIPSIMPGKWPPPLPVGTYTRNFLMTVNYIQELQNELNKPEINIEKIKNYLNNFLKGNYYVANVIEKNKKNITDLYEKLKQKFEVLNWLDSGMI